jgi:periplasmic protein CpxP/Spy
MHRSVQAYVVTIVVFLLLAGNALAQGMRMSAEERTDQLTKQLSLTVEQKTKVLELFRKSDEARRTAFGSGGGDRSSRREGMQKIRQDNEKKLKEILTEEQFAKYLKERPEPPRRPSN